MNNKHLLPLSIFSVISWASFILVIIFLEPCSVYSNYFNISLRQGILLALTTIGILVFLSLDILKWWTTLLLLITVILIEFNFLSREI